MSNGNAKLSTQLSHRSHVLGLRLWQIIALALGALTVVVLFLLALRLRALRWTSKSRKQKLHPDFINNSPIPIISKEIKEVQVTDGTLSLHPHIVAHPEPASVYRLPIPSVGRVSSWGQRSTSTVDILDDEKQVVTFAYEGDMDVNVQDFQSIINPKLAAAEAPEMQQSPIIKHNAVAEIGSNFSRMNERTEPLAITITECEFASVSVGSSTHNISYDECQLYWAGCKGKRYSIEELEHATDQFAEGNILGKGGYGVVYQGLLYDGSVVAVKHLINVSRNPSEEFTVEVEAISCVRHKNLVGLLGYCAQGPHRLLVYEYVDNGNLEQWLHGPLGTSQPIPWNRRMNIVLGTAKGLAYLHEDLEPKVVHRDVKASNILLDSSWNAKISDFGLAKLLGDGKSHVTTRVMGTFGFVAPEYASTGLLTESSDVYSFGVLMMEVITGRDPVDYSRPAREMNVVDWTKRMVESKRWEDVADPQLPEKPSGRALKRALLVALRCVDPDAQRRPRMGQIVYMLEADDISFHHVCNNRRKVEGHVKGRSFRQADRPDSRGQKDSFHY